MNDVKLLPLHLADALDCFWNASLGATRGHDDATANAVMHGIVEGFAAVATRLRETASPALTHPAPADVARLVGAARRIDGEWGFATSGGSVAISADNLAKLRSEIAPFTTTQQEVQS